MSITPLRTAIATAILLASPLALNAQAPSLGLTVGLKASTLGVGPEIGVRLASHLGLRGGFNIFSVSRAFTTDDIDYNASFKLNTIHALVDLYLAGPFRLSGGVMRNGNKLELSADPTVAVDIGNTTYQASDVGTISGKIDFRKAAGYVGLGIGGRGRVGFIMDLGVMLQGSPRVSYSATTTLPAGPAQTAFNDEVQTEAANVQLDINDRSYLKLWPVVGIGLQVRI